MPGLSVAISKDGHIWSAGFGKADLEQDVPVTAQSMFRTASVAKWFTATAVMRLADDGKLDLDAPVQRYCATFPEKTWPITSRQLLTRMSGVRHNYGDNGEKPETDAERLALAERIQREKSGQYVRYTDVIKPLEAFKDDPLLFRPGTRVQYSSPGYRLLGCVLEGAAKMPYRKPFGSPDYYYGVGIMIGPIGRRQAWFHTGGQSGASTLLFCFPYSGIAVALMSNRDGSAIREPLARKLEEIAARETAPD